MFGVMTRLQQTLARTAIPDIVVRLIERARGIYYPSSLIGRCNCPPTSIRKGGVLVVAAHQDDEVLGIGVTLARHQARGDTVTVVFTTNGAGGRWKDRSEIQQKMSANRLKESYKALAVIGIRPENVVCLGFPDGGLHRYIAEASRDIAALLRTILPRTIYAHAIEGGHLDHDVTAFVVQNVSAKLGMDDVFEWAEYNREVRSGQPVSDARFASDPYAGDFECTPTVFEQTEVAIKQEMLSKYVSQATVIADYPFKGEILRKAKTTKLFPRLVYFTRLSEGRFRFLLGGMRSRSSAE